MRVRRGRTQLPHDESELYGVHVLKRTQIQREMFDCHGDVVIGFTGDSPVPVKRSLAAATPVPLQIVCTQWVLSSTHRTYFLLLPFKSHAFPTESVTARTNYNLRRRGIQIS